MHLAICDDNELERELLCELLRKYFSKTSVKCEFTLFDGGQNLYYDVTEGIDYDMIFLDLFMEDSFGMNIAQKLRELPYRGKIVFCTSSADYAVESYGVEAAGYILKPYGIADIKQTMDRVLPAFRCESYLVKQKSRMVYIPMDEIMYVESDNTRCIIHRTEQRQYTLYKHLGQVEEELGDGRFLRCHQSYLVNMNYIREAGDSFVLSTGEEILIRQKSRKEMHQRFRDYMENPLLTKPKIHAGETD